MNPIHDNNNKRTSDYEEEIVAKKIKTEISFLEHLPLELVLLILEDCVPKDLITTSILNKKFNGFTKIISLKLLVDSCENHSQIQQVLSYSSRISYLTIQNFSIQQYSIKTLLNKLEKLENLSKG